VWLLVASVQLWLLLLPGFAWAQGRAHLGVLIQNAGRMPESSGTSVREGVVVLGLLRNSPAEQAGVQRGDVIIRFNEQPVRQVEDLQRLVSEAPLGETAAIEVVRRDQTLVIPLMLEPISGAVPITGPSDTAPWLLQREEIVWIALGGAAISLIAVYLVSVLPRWRRRLPSPGAGSPAPQHLGVRLSRHRLTVVSAGFLAVIIFWSSLRVIEGGHRGVVFHLMHGVQERTLGEGMHVLLPVLNRLSVYDMRSRVYHMQRRAAPSRRGPAQNEDPLLWTPTADGLKVGLDLSVRYRLDPTRLPELHRNVGPQVEEKVVHPIAWNVTRLVASEYSLLDMYGKHRHEIQQQAFERVKALFARDGLICEALLLRDVVFTREFEKTLVTKMIAEQKVQESAFEVEQAGLQAQVQVIEAHGEAQALEMVNRAIHSQPLLLQYLWIKSLPERVKIMVMPNASGKSTPWIKLAPSESQRAPAPE